jgi:hypothetical protein
MSDLKRAPRQNEEHGEEDSASGVNLKLIYGLMLLGLLAAIAFAALIVLPFYNRR